MGAGTGFGALAGGESPSGSLKIGETTAALTPAFGAMTPIAKFIKRGVVGGGAPGAGSSAVMDILSLMPGPIGKIYRQSSN